MWILGLKGLTNNGNESITKELKMCITLSLRTITLERTRKEKTGKFNLTSLAS